jgi:hypothetical protein
MLSGENVPEVVAEQSSGMGEDIRKQRVGEPVSAAMTPVDEQAGISDEDNIYGRNWGLGRPKGSNRVK